MKLCAVCGNPMTPNGNGRLWCAVWGDHGQPEPGALMLAADLEMQALDASTMSRFKRKDRP